MPIYDYVCSSCATTTEVIHGIDAAGPRFCPACGADGTLRKAFVAPSVHFKGSGWAKKDRSASSTSRTKAAGGSGSGDGTDTSGSGKSGSKDEGSGGSGGKDGASSGGSPSTGSSSGDSGGAKSPTVSEG